MNNRTPTEHDKKSARDRFTKQDRVLLIKDSLKAFGIPSSLLCLYLILGANPLYISLVASGLFVGVILSAFYRDKREGTRRFFDFCRAKLW